MYMIFDISSPSCSGATSPRSTFLAIAISCSVCGMEKIRSKASLEEIRYNAREKKYEAVVSYPYITYTEYMGIVFVKVKVYQKRKKSSLKVYH